MATSEYNLNQLDGILAAENLDPSVIQAINDYLGAGFHGDVQIDGYPPLDPNAEVLIVDNVSGPLVVPTNSNLQLIVDADANVTVTGSNNVFVATGASDDTVNMASSSGDDVVQTGSGKDTILGGQGADSIYGGDGNDSITGGVAGTGGFADYPVARWRRRQ